MEIGVTKSAAQSIVETIKDFCGYDINFIDTEGFIFASTDTNRIGDYHEIGKKVADTQKSIEVCETDEYTGTHPGINTPFFHEGRIIAVIGITGDPDKVRQYCELALRITALIFRENEYANQSLGRQTATNYIIRSLINGEALNKNHLDDFMNSRKLSLDNNYRTAVVEIHSRYNPANISFIERDITDTLSEIPGSLYRYQYPNEFVLIFDVSGYKTAVNALQNMLKKYSEIMKVAVGREDPLNRQNHSYASACLALKCSVNPKSVAVFDDFDLEILLASLNDTVSKRYLAKTTDYLSSEDVEILNAYYEANMSLKEASEKLFIHKNTLQYRLDKIYEKSGYNPRSFRDATILYLALELMKVKK